MYGKRLAVWLFVICVYILGIHSSNEFREALEKTIKEEFSHYSGLKIM